MDVKEYRNGCVSTLDGLAAAAVYQTSLDLYQTVMLNGFGHVQLLGNGNIDAKLRMASELALDDLAKTAQDLGCRYVIGVSATSIMTKEGVLGIMYQGTGLVPKSQLSIEKPKE
ncbi:hypothetical protein HYV86_02730 [Candidatus Woesearchaeota archaeon]|nr:hypothetical protein [Candidatus Woesearchaeota archaeon]